MAASQSLHTFSACAVLLYCVEACKDSKYIELASIKYAKEE